MLPKRKSALVLPVKRSSTESCSDILDLRPEHKKFKTHLDDVTSPPHFTDDVNSFSTSTQINSKLPKDKSFPSSPPLSGSEVRVCAAKTVKCCGGCSESFASFHQMFSHLNSTSHNKTPSNVSNAERPYFDDISHLPAPPDFASFSSTPSALERLVNSSLFQTPLENLLDLSNGKTHCSSKLSGKTHIFSSDFQPAEDETNEIASIQKHGVLRRCIAMNTSDDVNEEAERVAEGLKVSFAANKAKTSRNCSRSSIVESPFEQSSTKESEKLKKSYKCTGNRTNPRSTNQNSPKRNHYQSSGQSHLLQQTRQNFLHNYLQSVFCQDYKVQNLMDLLHQNEIQKFMQQSFIDPKLVFLLSNQTRFPWIQPPYRDSAFSFNASNRNLPSNESSFQSILRDQTTSVCGDSNPQAIDSQPKTPSSSWSEKAKSNVWLMMGHGNTCFACGRSFTSKGSFRYHLSRCHVLSGINAR